MSDNILCMEQIHINQYLESKRNAWSETTKRSEGYRLTALLPLLNQANNDPNKFYDLIKAQYKPYTTRTIFARVADFMDFFGNEVYSNYVTANANLFKHVYQTKQLDYTFEEARERIQLIRHPEVKKVANLMLSTGMRIHEALKYDGSGQVIGKGSKPRPIFSKETTDGSVNEQLVRRHCKKVGINPHSLRKLAATQLAKSGLSEIDLLFTMGWSNIQTATKYLQPTKQEELASKVQKALGGK
jgi:integrase